MASKQRWVRAENLPTNPFSLGEVSGTVGGHRLADGFERRGGQTGHRGQLGDFPDYQMAIQPNSPSRPETQYHARESL